MGQSVLALFTALLDALRARSTREHGLAAELLEARLSQTSVPA